jgi:hypothetical protein
VFVLLEYAERLQCSAELSWRWPLLAEQESHVPLAGRPFGSLVTAGRAQQMLDTFESYAVYSVHLLLLVN